MKTVKKLRRRRLAPCNCWKAPRKQELDGFVGDAGTDGVGRELPCLRVAGLGAAQVRVRIHEVGQEGSVTEVDTLASTGMAASGPTASMRPP